MALPFHCAQRSRWQVLASEENHTMSLLTSDSEFKEPAAHASSTWKTVSDAKGFKFAANPKSDSSISNDSGQHRSRVKASLKHCPSSFKTTQQKYARGMSEVDGQQSSILRLCSAARSGRPISVRVRPAKSTSFTKTGLAPRKRDKLTNPNNASVHLPSEGSIGWLVAGQGVHREQNMSKSRYF